MSISLFELSEDHRRMIDALADEEDADKAAQILESVEMVVKDKAAMVAKFALDADASIATLKEAAKRLNDRVSMYEKKAERLRSYIEACLIRAGIESVDTPLVTIKFAKNPPSVHVYDESAIEDEFFIVPPAPEKRLDKKAVASAIKSGRNVSGAELVQTTRLVIK